MSAKGALAQELAELKSQVGEGEELDTSLLEDARKWDEYQSERSGRMRDAVRELFHQFNDNHSESAWTLWGLYNAGVEFEDYKNGPVKSSAESTLFGARARTKAKIAQAVFSRTTTGMRPKALAAGRG